MQNRFWSSDTLAQYRAISL